MAEESIVLTVLRYLHNRSLQGIPVAFAVAFGSPARGEANRWSDIDLLVASPRFDQTRRREDIGLLWKVAACTNSRIEPFPAGQQQYLTDESSAIIEIARREGQIIPLAE